MAKRLEITEEDIQEDFSYISPKDGKTYTLTLKEKLFCDSYLDFKGNGVQAVFEAGYECKNAIVAAAIAHENLRKPHLIAYVNSKLEEFGFNDDEAYKQHLYLMNQHADLKSKAKAIDMYYKLKGSYAPEKKDLTTQGEKIASADLDELATKMSEKLKEQKI